MGGGSQACNPGDCWTEFSSGGSTEARSAPEFPTGFGGTHLLAMVGCKFFFVLAGYRTPDSFQFPSTPDIAPYLLKPARRPLGHLAPT